METATLAQWVFGIIMFGIPPLVIAVIIPSLIISKIIKRIISRGKASLPSIWPFVLFITILAILANFLWYIFVNNKIYYHWNSLLLTPYTLLFHESPDLGLSPDWLAYDWELGHLDLLWIGITVLVCLISGLIAILLNRKSVNLAKYKKVIFISIIAIVFLSIFSGTFLTRSYKKNVSCLTNKSSEKKILYQSFDSKTPFSISDLSGKNMQELPWENDLLGENVLSSDGSMLAKFDNETLRLMVNCEQKRSVVSINTISLPETHNNIKEGRLISKADWSPDNKKIVLNRYGDLILVDVIKRSAKVLKHNVTPEIGYNPNNKEDRPEVGLAKWDADDSVYYTSYEKESGKVSLYKLIPQTNQNELITSSSDFIESVKISRNGEILLVSEHPWNTLNKNFWYIINMKTGKRSSINADSFSELSPSGRYVDVNYMTPNAVSTGTSYPYILDTGSGAKLSIRDTVMQALIKNNVTYIDVANKPDLSDRNKLVDSITMRIVGFVDDNRMLLELTIHYSADSSYRDTVGIFSIKTNEFTILHNRVRKNIADIKLWPIEVVGR
ncbi:MAG: hypothetical protein AAB583_06490 [Patescibacteria group bacterium]